MFRYYWSKWQNQTTDTAETFTTGLKKVKRTIKCDRCKKVIGYYYEYEYLSGSSTSAMPGVKQPERLCPRCYKIGKLKE